MARALWGYTVRLVVVLWSALLLWSAPALAQNDPSAVELYEQSVEHYNAGRFSVAAELLREALEIQPNEPTLQYNLARALEGHGDLDGAIESYELLLGHDELDDRGAIEERLATLRRQRDQARELERLRQSPEHDTSEPIEEPEEVEAVQAPRRPSVAPWIVAGVGVASLGVGVTFGALAVDRNNDALQEPIHERAERFRDEAEQRQRIANACLVAGGVLAGVGLVWGIVDVSKSNDVDVAIGPGGVRLRGRF